jgi:hypothetical protein
MIAIKIRTKNDTNGNPRRGWIIVDEEGEVVNFIDEGYAGKGALHTYAHKHYIVEGPEIQVGPGEYRAWKGLRYD